MTNRERSGAGNPLGRGGWATKTSDVPRKHPQHHGHFTSCPITVVYSRLEPGHEGEGATTYLFLADCAGSEALAGRRRNPVQAEVHDQLAVDVPGVPDDVVHHPDPG